MRRFIPFVLAVAVLGAACAEDEEPEGASTTLEGDVAPEECAEVSSSEGAPAPLTMKDTFFDPTCLAVSSTQAMTLTNAGNALHNFSMPEQGVDIDVEPGEDEETDTFEDLGVEAGTYRFACKYHEAQGMVGTIVIE
jgi:plastocyanin